MEFECWVFLQSESVVQAESSIRTESLKLGFSKHSYGFRPGRSQRQALEAAQKTVKEGKEYVVDIDLERFFDRIYHDRLINRMKLQISDKRILRLTGMVLRSGIMEDGLVRAMRVLRKEVHLACY